MNTFYYVLSVAWKDIQLLARDRGTLAILFLLPTLLGSVTCGANMAMSQEEETGILLDVCLVNLDSGDFGREVSKAIKTIEELEVEVLDSSAEAEGLVAKGESAAAIVIPTDFSQKINDHTPTEIEVIVDPAEPETASIVTGIMNMVVDEVTIWGEVAYGIRTILDESGVFAEASPDQLRGIEAQNLGVVMTSLNEMRSNPAITVVSEDIGGAKVEGGLTLFFAYVFPAFTVMFIFFIIGTASTSLLHERETGVLRRLLTATAPRGAILGGKVLAYMLIPCLQTILLFGIGNLFFDMPLGSSPLGLVVVTLVVAMVAVSLGMMIASLAKSSSQADNVSMLLSFVLAGVGGSIPLSGTPLSRTGGLFGIISKLTPHAHAVEAYYRLMAENATFVQVLPEVGILLLIGIVFFAVALWRFRFE